MAQSKEPVNGYVRKETLMLVAFVTLIVGFIGGIVFSAFKSDTGMPSQGQVTAMPPQTSAGPAAGPDLTNAILDAEKEVAANPQNTKAWVRLGNLYFDSNKFKDAIRAYEKSLKLDTNNADVLTDLGVMYRRDHQPNEAIRSFDKAMSVNPRHEISRFNKGIVLMHDLNDMEGAIAAWEDLVKVNPLAMTPTGQSVDELVQKMKASKNQ